jgi:purine-binding chemotaxis protein CheW
MAMRGQDLAGASAYRSGTMGVVGFYLGKEEHALELLQVQTIVKLQDITRVPRTPPFVMGVMNLRGQIVPVIDLKKRFKLGGDTEVGPKTRLIIVRLDEGQVGVVVDEVTGTFDLPTDSIEPPPQTAGSGIESTYIQGIGKIDDHLLILLDLKKIFSPDVWSAAMAASGFGTGKTTAGSSKGTIQIIHKGS